MFRLALPLICLLGPTGAQAEAPALEATEPSAACERFVSPIEADHCRALHQKLDLDWYAAAICARMDEDEAYLSCLKSIDGRLGAPKKLAACGDPALADAERGRCVESGLAASKTTSSQGRRPAAKSAPDHEAFQPARPVRKPAR
jgi:hypothetical protein